MRKPKATDYRRLAQEIARDSIVTQATARLVEQIVAEVHTAKQEEIDQLDEQLQGYAESRNAALAERDLAYAQRDAALAALRQADEALWQLLDDMRDGLCVCHAAKEQAQEALAQIDTVLEGGNE